MHEHQFVASARCKLEVMVHEGSVPPGTVGRGPLNIHGGSPIETP